MSTSRRIKTMMQRMLSTWFTVIIFLKLFANPLEAKLPFYARSELLFSCLQL